jgi:hypothetical protein
MIYIECDADEVLIRQLGIARKEFSHEGGKFEICRRLQKVRNSIGLIEHDYGATDPSYVKRCILTEEKFAIKIYRDKASENKLIILFNDLEDWVLNVSKKNKIEVAQFGLESERNALHRSMPMRLNAFKKLIDRLIEVKSIELSFLQSQLKKIEPTH